MPSRIVGFACFGLAWGVVAWLLGARAVGPSIVVGTTVSPLIGIFVGIALQRHFESASWGRRILLALASLYLGATLFAITLGIRDFIVQSAARNAETIWQNVIGLWYGTSVFLIALWPMAYLTHVALATDIPWWRRPSR